MVVKESETMEENIIRFKIGVPQNIHESNLNTVILDLHEIRNIIECGTQNANILEYNKKIERTQKTLENLKLKYEVI